MKSTVTCFGGVDTVTGANFLLNVYTSEKTVSILVDCGFFQGSEYATQENRSPFPYSPKDIDYLFVTHAHADHIGRIPKFVRDGFKGVIYSTSVTRDISQVMFADAQNILEREAAEKGILPMYSDADVANALNLWKTFEYHEHVELPGGVTVTAKNSGHILGSAMFEFARQGRSMVFTGDLGNTPSPLLQDTESAGTPNYLLMESVYGDKNHEDKESRQEKLADAVSSTVKKNGTLVIPAFSLERTQVILYELNNLVEEKKIPSIPVYLDSPLAIKVTEIYRRTRSQFNHGVQKEIASGDDIFSFPRLQFSASSFESHKIENVHGPKIIIAGGGMSEGGRVVGHEKAYLPEERNTILLVGYQSVNTLGRALKSGAKEVEIEGERIPVRAEIRSISGFSSHKDSDHLLEFVADAGEKLEMVFVTMGEPKAAMFLAQKIRDTLDIKTICPERGRAYEIEL